MATLLIKTPLNTSSFLSKKKKNFIFVFFYNLLKDFSVKDSSSAICRKDCRKHCLPIDVGSAQSIELYKLFCVVLSYLLWLVYCP